MSGILERIKKEDRAWREDVSLEFWIDRDVGKFIEWYSRNVMRLKDKPMYTSHLISLARRWKDPEKLNRLWTRAMLEGGDDGA